MSNKKYNQGCLLLLTVLFLGACSTTKNIDVKTTVPVEERSVVDGQVLPYPDEPEITSQALSTAPSMSVVASKLLVSSNTQSNAGDWDGAANSLERALRLEPSNALLWSRLARVRYQQQNWQQAVQLAAKSNTLVAENISLRRQNWNMMANSYDALGDLLLAQKYRQLLSQ